MFGKIIGNPLKYASIERERKFLISPDKDLINGLPFKNITDHYINNTYLRFRKVTDNSGSVYKLTKKTPTESADKTVITTIYLTEYEYEMLNKIESFQVEKTRFIKSIDDIKIGIDKYVKGDDELWLTEIEFESDEQMKNFTMPVNYIKEVTDDPEFNGYQLAKRFGLIKT